MKRLLLVLLLITTGCAYAGETVRLVGNGRTSGQQGKELESDDTGSASILEVSEQLRTDAFEWGIDGGTAVGSSLTLVNDLAVADGGTGASNAADARTNLGVVIGTNVQAYDADLTIWAGLTPSANAQSLVTAADYAAMRALLDLEVGTDFLSPAAIAAAYQPLDAELTALAGLTSAADALPYFTGSGTASTTTLTSFTRGLLDDTTAPAAATTLGLGTGNTVTFAGITNTPIGATPSTGAFTTLSTTGNAGIGGTASTRLHVVNGAGALPSLFAETLLLVQRNDTTARNSFMTLLAGTAGASGISFGDTDVENRGIIQYLHSSDEFRVRTAGGSSTVFVNSSGNVGIKAAPGSYALDVSGSAQIDGPLTINDAQADVDSQIKADAGVAIYVDAGADSGAGYIGIRDSTPSYPLDVSGEANVTSLLLGTEVSIKKGTGDPTGVVTANEGSLYLSTNGSGYNLWINEGGTSADWVARNDSTFGWSVGGTTRIDSAGHYYPNRVTGAAAAALDGVMGIASGTGDTDERYFYYVDPGTGNMFYTLLTEGAIP